MSDSVRAARLPSEALAQRRLPAGLLSVVFHACLLVLAGLCWPQAPGGAVVEPVRSAGIVLAQQQGDKRQYWSPQELEVVSSDPASPQSISDVLPGSGTSSAGLAAELPSTAGLGAGQELAAALPSAGAFVQGAARGGGPKSGSYGVQTGVFGIQGTGSKFVFIFDRSASMAGFGGRPLAAAKSELRAGLAPLQSTHQFQIIFYNEQPQVFNPSPQQSPRMMFGDEATKALADRFVGAIAASGGTRHMEALMMGLGLQPDVIFFLTDAAEPQLSAAELAKIRRRNQRIGAAIHTVEFGSGPTTGETNFLTALARDNGGQYVYVDVTRLPRPGAPDG